MTRMYDAIEAGAVPTDGDLYAGYVDGQWPSYAALVRRFPGKPVVSITVLGTPGAHVADVETGDLTPQSGARWAHNEIVAGRRPTLYVNGSNLAATAAALVGYGHAFGVDVDCWLARYDHDPTLPPNVVAKQYESTDAYDISSVADGWPAQPWRPLPPPNVSTFTDPEEGSMVRTALTIRTDANGCGWTQTNIPADKVISVTCNRSAPGVDHVYWFGTAGYQMRDGGNALVSVTNCPPSTDQVVFVVSAG